MKSFPFDSVVTYDSEGNPMFDRAVNSDILSEYFHLLFVDGIFPEPSTNLQVTASTQDMSIVVKPGNVNIQGRFGIEEDERTLVFEVAGTAYDRIDSVVARLNTNYDYRKIDLYVVKGTEASSPVAPELTRSGGIYELRLANVFIPKNSTVISSERITDTRLVTEDCGIVTANPKSIDTTTLFEQYQAELAAFKAGSEQDILDWFEKVKEKLNENVAVNLQNQIGDLEELKTNEKSALVKAVNEVYEMAQNGGKDLVGDEYDPAVSYAVGTYCVYENVLYKNITATTGTASEPEAFSSVKWEAVDVAGELKQQNEKLDSFEQTKAGIVGSGLGTALSLTASTTWANLVSKIKAIVNRGAWNGSITASGGSVTVPAGYHNGSGKVSGPTLANLIGSNVNLNSNNSLMSGVTGYGVNGAKYTGNIVNRGALNWSGSNTTYSVPSGYYSGGTLDSRPSYNAGVTAADNRANANSTNYKTGYNAGYSAGVASGQTSSNSSFVAVIRDLVTTNDSGKEYNVTGIVNMNSAVVSNNNGTLTFKKSCKIRIFVHWYSIYAGTKYIKYSYNNAAGVVIGTSGTNGHGSKDLSVAANSTLKFIRYDDENANTRTDYFICIILL